MSKAAEAYRVRVYDEHHVFVHEIECGDRRQDAFDCGGTIPLAPGHRVAVVVDDGPKSELIGMRFA